MDYHKKVRRWYREAVRLNRGADPALRDTLLNSLSPPPRVETLLTNLENQIKTIQAVRLSKGRKPVAQHVVKDMVFDFVNVFMANMETEAKLRYESDNARILREEKAQELKDMEATLAGKPSGIFEEGGVLIDESRKDEVIPQR